MEHVETIIIDEVSMIGCRLLANISTVLSLGKSVDTEVAFGGVDIIFFCDFVQFPPVKDSPPRGKKSNWLTFMATDKQHDSVRSANEMHRSALP